MAVTLVRTRMVLLDTDGPIVIVNDRPCSDHIAQQPSAAVSSHIIQQNNNVNN